MPPEQKAPSSAGAKVTVACKLPPGIELWLHKPTTVRHAKPGGGFDEVTEWRRRTDVGPVKINGNAVPHGKQPAYRIVSPGGAPLTDGYALTEGVDKDFFDEWLKQHADSDIVKNRLVFAYERADMAADAAKEKAKSVRTGLEPVTQGKDPRADRRIEKAEVQAA